MPKPIPDFPWYSAESKRLGLSPRCPFQNVNVCPRYFYSLSLFGDYGCTKIEKTEDDRLVAFWKGSPLAPETHEQETSVTNTETKRYSYHNFCPEVAHDRFHLFATSLYSYADVEDSERAGERLAKEGVPGDHPDYYWSAFTPQHYAECPFYSQLSHDWHKLLVRPQVVSPSGPAAPAVRFDAFISHASEDKETFVRSLAAELTRLGIRVWYDESTLKLGDSLRAKIDEGLACSDFGVVVLSHAFFGKNWPQAELGALFAREMQGRKVILPVRHGLTQADVVKYSPLLADKLATLTEKGVRAVAAEIFAVVRPSMPAPQLAANEPEYNSAPQRMAQTTEPITTLLYGAQAVAPLLYKLDEPLEGEDARRFVCAMQNFFHGTNLLTIDLDPDLLTATDNLLRVTSMAGDLHYQVGKLATAMRHLELYRQRAGFRLEICPPSGRESLRGEIHFLHGTLLNMIEGANDPSKGNMLLLRLTISVLEYAQNQFDPKHQYPRIGPSVHQAIRDYLKHAVAVHLNSTLPDSIDNIAVSDMKEYCRPAWEELKKGDQTSFWQFLSVWSAYSSAPSALLEGRHVSDPPHTRAPLPDGCAATPAGSPKLRQGTSPLEAERRACISSPKVLLHTHLEGSLPPEAVTLLARRNAVELPFDPHTGDLAKLCQKGDWKSFRAVFEALCSCFRTRQDFADALVHYAHKLRSHNVIYAEIHCSPWKHLSRGVALDEIAEGLLLGIDRAKERCNLTVRIIIDLTRNPAEQAPRIIDWLVSLPNRGFVGLGISGGSGARPRSEYSKFAAKVKAHGFAVTVHAGELEGPESVRDAIHHLFADRIGHGVRSLEDPSLVDFLREHAIHLEVCPTANRIVGVGAADSSHIRELLASGLSFSINTDDELIFQTDPTRELEYLVDSDLLCLDDIPGLTLNAARAAFSGHEAIQLLQNEATSSNVVPS